ncbi:KH domain-containing protein [Candidatus Woesebacteria bacterium]|nr:KH domain-containing protein [Candidatus Woesebacteria bacterium]
MEDLLTFLAKGITGEKEIKVVQEENNGFINYNIIAPKEAIGLLVGKGGKTIRAIRNVLKVRAILEKKAVGVMVSEA